MPNLHFNSLLDLLEFQRATLEGQTPLAEAPESSWRSVYVDRHGMGYALGFDDAAWGDGLVLRGERREESAHGTRYDVEALLLGVPLQRNLREAETPSLVTLATEIDEGADPEQATSAAEQRIHDALVDLPTSEDPSIRLFLSGPQGPSGEPERVTWVVALVLGVHEDVSWTDFDGRHDDVTVFLPAWTGGELLCYVFVERGWRYPLPEDFQHLAEPREDALLLARPRPGAQVQPGNGCELVRAQWTEVASETELRFWDLRSWDLPTDPKPSVVSLKPAVDRTEAPSIELAQGDSPAGRGRLGIEQRIADAERMLEQLNARRAREVLRKQQEYRPAYLFRNERRRDGGDGELPRPLRAFLQRPRGELMGYRYTAAEHGGRVAHFVIGEMSMPLSSALAVACDELYLCPARWSNWDLQLFVRADTSLNVDVVEHEVATQLRSLLTGELGLDGDRPVLVEPAGGGPPSRGGPLRFLLLPEGVPLHSGEPGRSAVRLVNGQGSVRERLDKARTEAVEDVVDCERAELQPALQALDEAVRHQAAEDIARTEERLEKARRALEEASLHTLFVELISAEASRMCQEFPRTWEEFVRGITELTQQVAGAKLDSHSELEQDARNRYAEMQSIEVALASAAKLAEKLEKEAERREAELKKKEAQLKPRVDRLERASERVAQELEDVIALRRRLESAAEGVSAKLEQIDAELDSVEAEIGILLQRCALLVRQRAEAKGKQATRAKLDEEHQKLREEVHLLEGDPADVVSVRRKDLDELEVRLAELRQALPAEPGRRKHDEPERAGFWKRFGQVFGRGGRR